MYPGAPHVRWHLATCSETVEKSERETLEDLLCLLGEQRLTKLVCREDELHHEFDRGVTLPT